MTEPEPDGDGRSGRWWRAGNLAAALAGLAAHAAGLGWSSLVMLCALLFAVRSFAAISVTSAALASRTSALERRVTGVASSAATSASVVTALSGLTALSSAQQAALATITATQFSLLASTNISFLSSLTQLPHQTSSNATSFSNSNFTALANAVNNLQGNLQSGNFEA